MGNDWIPIERAAADGQPFSSYQRQGILRRLQDGLLVARAQVVIAIERPKIFSDTPNSNDPLADVIAGMNFQWGEPVERRDFELKLPTEIWSPQKLGRIELGFWLTGEERLFAPATADHTYDGDRATFYGIEIQTVGQRNSQRAPVVKKGRPPSDAEICAKADAMKERGLSGYDLATRMRNELGFEHVATTHVRELIKGRYKARGRPKKNDAS